MPYSTDSSAPRVSIIIPFERFNPMLEHCLKHCLRLNYPHYEVLLCGDPPAPPPGLPRRCRYLQARGGISAKRNAALRAADPQAKFIAYLDSDSYPRADWLNNALAAFRDPTVGAVTGPNLTPEESSRRVRCAGKVIESPLVLGPFSRIYRPDTPAHDTSIGATCNLIVRRAVQDRIGGFDEELLTGEDLKFSLDILKKTRTRILFSPEIVAYHFRRPLLLPFLKQWLNYGARSFHAFRFASWGNAVLLLAPPLFVLGHALAALLAFLWPRWGFLYIGLCAAWLLLLLAEARRRNSGWGDALLSWAGMVALPFAVGMGPWIGLMTRRRVWLRSESALK